MSHLAVCDETMLLDFALHTPLDNPKIYACVATNESTVKDNQPASNARSPTNVTEVVMKFALSGADDSENSSKAVSALHQV